MKWKIPLFLIVLVLAGVAALYAFVRSYDANRLKPDIIAAVKRTTGRNLSIKGDIKVVFGLQPSLVIEGVSLENAAWGSRPRMLKVKRFELQLGLLPLINGTLEVRNAALINSEICIEVSKKGALNLPYPVAKSRKASPAEDDRRLFLPHIALKNIRITDSRLIFKGRLSTEPITLHIKRLRLGAAAPGGKAPLDLTATYNKHPLVAKGLVGSLYDLLDPDKPWSVELAANTIGAKLELDGHIKNVLKGSGMALDFKLVSRDVSRTAAAAGLRVPYKTGARLVGHLAGGLESEFKLSRLKFKTGRNQLQGFVRAKLIGGKPYFNATLTSDRLDLRPAGRTKKKAGKRPAPSPNRKIFSAEPFPTDFLKNVTANVGLRVKRCLLPRSALQNLKLNLTLKKGRLGLKPITAVIGSGKLRASASMLEIRKKLVVRAELDIDNLNAKRMLRELDISDALEGTIDINATLAGKGTSVAEIMAGANGHLSVIMGRGRFHNRLLTEVGGDLRAGLIDLLAPGDQAKELMEINCLVTRFDITNGTAAVRVLVMDTPELRAIGKGSIHLKSETLDIALNPVSKKGVGSDAIGRLNLSLGSLTRPFKLGGTLAEPSLAIDAQKAAITLGKALGGFTLFGPFGLAVLLIDGNGSQKDLCKTAAAIARRKHPPPQKAAPKKSRKKKKTSTNPGSLLKDLKKLFK